MLVVLDTNVLLSALWSHKSAPGRIVDAWRRRRFSLVTSVEQIAEFKRATKYPKLRLYLPRVAIGVMINELQAAEVVLERVRMRGESPDPGDDYLLACALASDADFLVTGDQALVDLKRIGRTQVLTPARFVAILEKRPRQR